MGYEKKKRQTAKFLWDFDSTNLDADSSTATGTIPIFTIPANTIIYGVEADVKTAVTGSTAEEVGDGNDVDGFLVDTFAASTGYYPINGQDSPRGAYALDSNAGGTDALDVSVSHSYKLYTSADTIDYKISGTATAGKIMFYIDFMVL